MAAAVAEVFGVVDGPGQAGDRSVDGLELVALEALVLEAAVMFSRAD